MDLGRMADASSIFLDEPHDEGIGMNGLDLVRKKSFRRKILPVKGDDEISFSTDRCCQNVPIVFVRELDGIDQGVISRYQAISSGRIHKATRFLELSSFHIGPILKNVSDPFIMDTIGPLGLEQIGKSKLHQEVAQRSGIQHAGVVYSNGLGHVSSPC